MRIVSKKTFMALPQGTIFSEYKPCIISGLFIKGCNPGEWRSDYLELDLIESVECKDSEERVDILDNSELDGSEFKFDYELYGRNGLFEDDQLYLVYSKEDVKRLIDVLSKTL